MAGYTGIRRLAVAEVVRNQELAEALVANSVQVLYMLGTL